MATLDRSAARSDARHFAETGPGGNVTTWLPLPAASNAAAPAEAAFSGASSPPVTLPVPAAPAAVDAAALAQMLALLSEPESSKGRAGTASPPLYPVHSHPAPVVAVAPSVPPSYASYPVVAPPTHAAQNYPMATAVAETPPWEAYVQAPEPSAGGGSRSDSVSGAAGGSRSGSVSNGGDGGGNPTPQRKQLTPFTVTLDEKTGRWAAFVSAPKLAGEAAKRPAQRQMLGVNYMDRHVALRACEAFAPPVWQAKSKDDVCDLCTSKFGLTKQRHHCRNCGHIVCKTCCELWPAAALPSTYIDAEDRKAVQVCACCRAANSKFREALRRGNVCDAMEAFSTGLVNIRSPNAWVADSAYPVHCAAAGGSLALMTWLVEERGAPLSFLAADGSRAPVLTRDRRSPLAVAAAYNHMDIVTYLIRERGCRAHEVTQTADLCRLVERLVMTGAAAGKDGGSSGSASGGGKPAAGGGDAGGVSGAAAAAAVSSPATSPPSPDAFAFNPSAPPSWEEHLNIGGSPASGASGSSGAATGAAVAAAAGGSAVFVDSGAEDCVVCMNGPVQMTFVPCGHAATCRQCGPLFAECPVCMSSVERAINMYKVSA